MEEIKWITLLRKNIYMTQMNLSMKQKQTHRHKRTDSKGARAGGGKSGLGVWG